MSIRSRLTPIWPGDRGPAVAMLAGFAAPAGVFLAATTGGLLVDGFDPGRALTTLGLVPCLAGRVVLSRWLVDPEP